MNSGATRFLTWIRALALINSANLDNLHNLCFSVSSSENGDEDSDLPQDFVIIIIYMGFGTQLIYSVILFYRTHQPGDYKLIHKVLYKALGIYKQWWFSLFVSHYVGLWHIINV